jgi:hypothetical protein
MEVDRLKSFSESAFRGIELFQQILAKFDNTEVRPKMKPEEKASR